MKEAIRKNLFLLPTDQGRQGFQANLYIKLLKNVSKKPIKSFAFEPEILNLSLLYENIFLNNVGRLCTPVPLAVHNETSLEKFYLKDVLKGDALHKVKEILEEKSFEVICKEDGPINYNTNIANYIFKKGSECKKQL